jgi:hypothetical protein
MALYKALPDISMNTIETFHQQKIAGKKHAIAVLANQELITPEALAKYGKVTVLTLEEIFGY